MRASGDFPVVVNLTGTSNNGVPNEATASVSLQLSTSVTKERIDKVRRQASESAFVQRHVAVDVGRDLRALRDRDILAMNEKEQRGSGPEDRAGRECGRGDCARMTTAVGILSTPERSLLTIRQPDGINVDIQFAGAAHASSGLGLRDRAPCNRTFRDYNFISDSDFLQNLEIDCLIYGGVRR